MAPFPVQYSQTGSKIADAAGTAAITFQCPNVKGGLIIGTITFQVVGSPRQIPVCTATINGGVIAVKRAGDRGVMTGEGDVLLFGQTLVLTWTNATPGARCEATFSGTGKR